MCSHFAGSKGGGRKGKGGGGRKRGKKGNEILPKNSRREAVTTNSGPGGRVKDPALQKRSRTLRKKSGACCRKRENGFAREN